MPLAVPKIATRNIQSMIHFAGMVEVILRAVIIWEDVVAFAI
jgi:hypothetical protein